MIVSVIAALVGQLFLDKTYFSAILDRGAVFWFEALGVWSFAAFWYIKTRELDPSVSWVPFRRKRARDS